MSPRNFARVREEIAETTARYIETLRVEAARRKLETTASPLEEVADICGFGSAEILRRPFFVGPVPRLEDIARPLHTDVSLFAGHSGPCASADIEGRD
jgi:hypothetical protein